MVLYIFFHEQDASNIDMQCVYFIWIHFLYIILKHIYLNVNKHCVFTKNVHNMHVPIQVMLWNSNMNILLHCRDVNIHGMHKIRNSCMLNLKKLKKKKNWDTISFPTNKIKIFCE